MFDAHPLPAFYFRVVFASTPGFDTSFQEVSGLTAEMKTEEYVEGGENRFAHRLPTGVRSSNLVLKRGVASMTSPLVLWCIDTLEGDFASAIKTRSLQVQLLNEKGFPVRAWSFYGSYPVKWSADALNAQKNEVAIEAVELAYTYMTRTI